MIRSFAHLARQARWSLKSSRRYLRSTHQHGGGCSSPSADRHVQRVRDRVDDFNYMMTSSYEVLQLISLASNRSSGAGRAMLKKNGDRGQHRHEPMVDVAFLLLISS